jgi:tetratricopeptide (TPR) repeat protein
LKIIVTCRTGEEINAIDSNDANDVNDALRNFIGSFPRVTCSDFGETELLLLAEKTGKPLDASQYDGTPGSVTLGLHAMKRRLRNAAPEAQALMKALFILRTAFIYDPAEPLLTAVLSKIYSVERADAKVEAAVSVLRNNGFLREAPSLAPAHDCYLTCEFFQYYQAGGKALDKDLRKLGPIVEKYGTFSDCKSLGTFWNAKEDYQEAVKYLQKAASGVAEDGVLGHQLSSALYFTGNIDAAIAVLKGVVASNPNDLIALCNLALFQRINGVPGEEVLKTIGAAPAAYDVYKRGGFAVVRAGSDLYKWTGPAPVLARSVAGVLGMKGRVLRDLGRHEEAVQALDDVIREFGDLPPSFDFPIAQAFFNKAIIMAVLHRRGEAIRAYDGVLSRFNASAEPLMRLAVAKAGVNKGIHLQHEGKEEEALAAFNDVLGRFGKDRDPKLREQLVRGVVESAYSLSELNRHDEAIKGCDAVLDLLGNARDVASKVYVARALLRKSFALNELNRDQKAISPCNEVLRRFGTTTEPQLQRYIAKALLQKGTFLLQLNEESEARAVLSQLVERFEHSTEPQLQNYAVMAANSLSLLSLSGNSQMVVHLSKIPLSLYDGVDQD